MRSSQMMFAVLAGGLIIAEACFGASTADAGVSAAVTTTARAVTVSLLDPAERM